MYLGVDGEPSVAIYHAEVRQHSKRNVLKRLLALLPRDRRLLDTGKLVTHLKIFIYYSYSLNNLKIIFQGKRSKCQTKLNLLSFPSLGLRMICFTFRSEVADEGNVWMTDSVTRGAGGADWSLWAGALRRLHMDLRFPMPSWKSLLYFEWSQTRGSRGLFSVAFLQGRFEHILKSLSLSVISSRTRSCAETLLSMSAVRGSPPTSLLYKVFSEHSRDSGVDSEVMGQPRIFISAGIWKYQWGHRKTNIYWSFSTQPKCRGFGVIIMH